MEQKITSILFQMQEMLTIEQLNTLKDTLYMTLAGCEVVEKRQEIITVDNSWENELNEFLQAKSLEGKSKRTVNRYRYELTRLLSYISKSINDIEHIDITEYLNVYKRTRNVSNQTLKNVRAVFSTFFVWLRDMGKILQNPLAKVGVIKVERKIKKAYSDREMEMLLNNCQTVRDKALLEFLYSTGARISEVQALNVDDIHFSTKTLIVYGKGSKERKVYLNERSHMYLEEYLNSRDDRNPALFVSLYSPHARLTVEGLRNITKRIGLKAHINKVHPHRFRRTCLTNALNRGMPLQEVMTIAGHSKPETTMEYCNVDEDGIKYHHQKYLSA